jgi:predicted PurR-regulated permease PerM
MTDGRGLRILLALAALVLVVSGLRAAVNIVVPFLLAVFISTIASTPMFWLQRHGVPKVIALVAVILLIVVGGMGLGTLIGTSVREFTEAVPLYEQRLRGLVSDGIAFLQARGVEVTREMLPSFDPGFAMRMVGRTLQGLTSALSNTFLILLTVIFMLLEAHSIPRKLAEILQDPDESLPRFESFSETINRYMAIKTTTSALTGILAYALNMLMGVDFAVLWGLLAFLLNYVPNIGSFIAAVPAVLLAAVQLGLGEAAFLGVAYFALNTVVGGMFEPRFMGQGLGLSTLVVWLSLVFWGWALGPVGMLLSVPLTVTLRIALEHRPDTHWIAVLLGPARELSSAAPPERAPEGAPATPAGPDGTG